MKDRVDQRDVPIVTDHRMARHTVRRHMRTEKEEARRLQLVQDDDGETRDGPAKAAGVSQSARGTGSACLFSPYPGGYSKSAAAVVLAREGIGRRRRHRRPGSEKET